MSIADTPTLCALNSEIRRNNEKNIVFTIFINNFSGHFPVLRDIFCIFSKPRNSRLMTIFLHIWQMVTQKNREKERKRKVKFIS